MASNLDLFLKLEGIDGESKKDGHPKEIDIASWSFTASQPVSMGGNNAGTTGKVQMSDISVTKPVDAASPKLFLACCQGDRVPKAFITGQKATGKGGQKVFYKVEMQDVVIAQVRNDYVHEDAVLDTITETVVMNPAKIYVSYWPIDNTGTPGSESKTGYDLQANKKL